jgi:signal transduction histidine kinase
MKSKLFYSILFLCIINLCKAQGSAIVLDTSMFDINFQTISLTGLNGWVFKEGNDVNWANSKIDTNGWIKMDPPGLTIKNADKNGKVEGWFRLKFRLDSSFRNFPTGIFSIRFAASDLYIDGQHAASFGNTGLDGKPYKEFRGNLEPPVNISLQTDTDHILALHIVDYRSRLNPYHLKTQDNGDPRGYGVLISLTGAGAHTKWINFLQGQVLYFTFWACACGILSALFWLLYFKNKSEKNLSIIAFSTTLLSAAAFLAKMQQSTGIPYSVYELYFYGQNFLVGPAFAVIIIVLANIFKRKITLPLALYCFFISFAFIIDLYFFENKAITLIAATTFFVCLYLIITSWRKLRGAQWSVVAGILLALAFVLLYAYNLAKFKRFPYPYVYLWLTGVFLSFPLSLMTYVASRFKEILNAVRSNANEVVKITEEKKEILAHQNEMLEKQVEERTEKLRQSLHDLKSAQAQLVQSEKMASLGELTAGIAHEIQNPLNFVNNFSEVNTELISELVDEVDKGNTEEVKAIAGDIKDNSEKIKHHGKRAGDIVRGMLQHSRTSTGKKEPTNINDLCDEYLRLSYHGLKAKDKSFDADFKTDFDESIGNINIIPQDIGRVLLNLINNAFYAVKSPNLLKGEQYKPLVSVTTRKANSSLGAGGIEIIVSDNGTGIPKRIVDKIFQPFFTTKPTGEGTGLGLSLSYDIIKVHGGEIKVDTKENEGTKFIISLPVS